METVNIADKVYVEPQGKVLEIELAAFEDGTYDWSDPYDEVLRGPFPSRDEAIADAVAFYSA